MFGAFGHRLLSGIDFQSLLFSFKVMESIPAFPSTLFKLLLMHFCCPPCSLIFCRWYLLMHFCCPPCSLIFCRWYLLMHFCCPPCSLIFCRWYLLMHFCFPPCSLIFCRWYLLMHFCFPPCSLIFCRWYLLMHFCFPPYSLIFCRWYLEPCVTWTNTVVQGQARLVPASLEGCVQSWVVKSHTIFSHWCPAQIAFLSCPWALSMVTVEGDQHWPHNLSKHRPCPGWV